MTQGRAGSYFLLNINRKEEFLRLFHTICSFQPAPVSVVRQWAGSVIREPKKGKVFLHQEVCLICPLLYGKGETMSRYIDAEWLLNFFVDIPNNFTLTIGNLRATVNDAPSIDIVRCGECKWAKANGTYQWCGRLDSTAQITANDFCSYGEVSENPTDSEKPNNLSEITTGSERSNE